MQAAETIRENRRAYGHILRTIRQAESLERAIRRGYSRPRIEAAVANYKQAAARSGPIIYTGGSSAPGEFNLTQGKRLT